MAPISDWRMEHIKPNTQNQYESMIPDPSADPQAVQSIPLVQPLKALSGQNRVHLNGCEISDQLEALDWSTNPEHPWTLHNIIVHKYYIKPVPCLLDYWKRVCKWLHQRFSEAWVWFGSVVWVPLLSRSLESCWFRIVMELRLWTFWITT